MFDTLPKKFRSDVPLELVTMIGSHTTLSGGRIQTSRDLRIDGTVKGDVVVEGRLVIGPEGRVEGAIAAGEMVLCGEVSGSVFVRRTLKIKSTAVVYGVVHAGTMSIEDGASGDFSARMGHPDRSDPESISLESALIAGKPRPYSGDGLGAPINQTVEMSVGGMSPSVTDLTTAPSEQRTAVTRSNGLGSKHRTGANEETALEKEIPPSDGEVSYETDRFW